MIPKDGFSWSFGDGTTATGPSVVHAFTKGGTYPVTLTVTDRGGDKGTSSQALNVAEPANGKSPVTALASKLRVLLQLLPESVSEMLKDGLNLDVLSNQAANGLASVFIDHRVARRAHMHIGGGNAPVRIGVGTLANIAPGLVNMRLHLSRAVRNHLRHTHTLRLTVRLALVGTSGDHLVIDAAGRY
jgi:hypothetical protein